MISFFMTIARFVKAIRYASEDAEFRALAVIVIALLLSGSVFYAAYESWSYTDALYFCVMTMTTIGYGDLAPTTDVSKMFTIIYAFISIGVFVSLAAKLATGLMHRKHKSTEITDKNNPA